MLAEWASFCMLRDEGRAAASAFLEADALGVRSSLDLNPYLEGA